MQLDKDNKKINSGDLFRIEKLIGFQLPQDYKKHMLKYNGGSVSIDTSYSFFHKKNKINFIRFYNYDRLIDRYEVKHSFLYPGLLPLGTITGGYLAIGYNPQNRGCIYVYYSDKTPEKIANSFTEFIDNLEEEGEFL